MKVMAFFRLSNIILQALTFGICCSQYSEDLSYTWFYNQDIAILNMLKNPIKSIAQKLVKSVCEYIRRLDKCVDLVKKKSDIGKNTIRALVLHDGPCFLRQKIKTNRMRNVHLWNETDVCSLTVAICFINILWSKVHRLYTWNMRRFHTQIKPPSWWVTAPVPTVHNLSLTPYTTTQHQQPDPTSATITLNNGTRTRENSSCAACTQWWLHHNTYANMLSLYVQ